MFDGLAEMEDQEDLLRKKEARASCAVCKGQQQELVWSSNASVETALFHFRWPCSACGGGRLTIDALAWDELGTMDVWIHGDGKGPAACVWDDFNRALGIIKKEMREKRESQGDK